MAAVFFSSPEQLPVGSPDKYPPSLVLRTSGGGGFIVCSLLAKSLVQQLMKLGGAL